MKKLFTIALFFLFSVCNRSLCQTDTIFLPIEEQLLKGKDKVAQGFEPINFKFAQVGRSKTKTIYINNSGSSPFRIQSIAFQLSGVGVFSFAANPSPPISINPDESIFINLNFSPKSVGQFYDTLLIVFDEPFEFVYALPVEGISFATNKIIIRDTSAFVGAKDFPIPIYIKGDSNIEEPVTTNLTFSLTFDASLFNLVSSEQGIIISKQQNGFFATVDLRFDNIQIDSTTKILTKIKGLVLLGYPDTTTFEIGSIRADTLGVLFDTRNGLFQAQGVCVAKISLIEMQEGITDLIAYPTPASETLTLEFPNYKPKQNEIVEITFCNTFGQIVERTTLEINSNTETINISKLTSGVYRLLLTYKNQTFSALINVVK